MIINTIYEYQGNGLLPSDEVVAISQVTDKIITVFDDYDGHPIQPNEILVCKSAAFVMEVKSTGGIFSFAEDGSIGTYTRRSNSFINSAFARKDDGTGSIKTLRMVGLGKLQAEFNKNNQRAVTPNIPKEEKPMANLMEELQNRINASEPKAQPMNLGDINPPKVPRNKRKEEMAAEASQFQGKIQQMLAGVRNSVSEDVCAYNQRFGRLLGYVTGNDAKIVFSVSKYKPKTDATAPVAGAAPEYKITVRQSKPSKPKAVIFTIPENTFKSLDELAERREDYTMSKLMEVGNPTMVTQIEATDIAHRIILLYFKGVIAESETVWANAGHAGEQGKVECGYKSKVSKKGNGTPELHAYMKAYRESGISSQLTGWNYIPLKVYKTIPVGASVALAANDMAKLVDTVYRPLQNNGGAGEAKDDASTKFNRLHPSSKNLFHFNPDGSVSVDFFKRDTPAFSSVMNVKNFWSPRKELYTVAGDTGIVEIAYKEDVKPADETKAPRFMYSTISILEDEGEVIFRKFGDFVSAVGADVLNVDNLKRFARRTASKKTEANVIRGLAAQRLALGELGGSLQSVNGLKMDAIQDLGAALEASREVANASLLKAIK